MTMRANVVVRPSAEELAGLRARHLTLNEISAFYGVSRSLAKRWCSELKIAALPRVARTEKPDYRPVEEADNGEGLTAAERAAKVLGIRMSEDRRRGMYLLDGKPVNIEALLAAAGLAIATSSKVTFDGR